MAISFVNWLSDKIVSRLQRQTRGYRPYTPSDQKNLKQVLMPGDVILVEGDRKVSAAIKYLTQSTWSHAAVFIGYDRLPPRPDGLQNCLIEAEISEGVIASPLAKLASYNTRICRPLNLTDEDREHMIQYLIARIGDRYDLSNIIDLARYLVPNIPMPLRFRRRFISLGAGDPTRAICSTLIAQAFQEIKYPILPSIIEIEGHARSTSRYSRKEIMRIRDYSLFTPRDFDVSPYFQIIKPTLKSGFNYQDIVWDQTSDHI